MDQRYVTEEKKKCADSVLTVSGSLISKCLTKLPVVDARVWGSQRVSAYTYLWPDSPQNGARGSSIRESRGPVRRFAGDRAIADFESEPSQPALSYRTAP